VTHYRCKWLLLALLATAGARGETCQSFPRRSAEFRFGYVDGLTAGYSTGYINGHVDAENMHNAHEAMQAYNEGKKPGPPLPKAEMSETYPYNHLNSDSLLQGIDEVCKASENARVEVQYAAIAFFMKLKGRDPADVENFLRLVRKNAAKQ
jgi:hypothetical protein